MVNPSVAIFGLMTVLASWGDPTCSPDRCRTGESASLRGSGFKTKTCSAVYIWKGWGWVLIRSFLIFCVTCGFLHEIIGGRIERRSALPSAMLALRIAFLDCDLSVYLAFVFVASNPKPCGEICFSVHCMCVINTPVIPIYAFTIQ